MVTVEEMLKKRVAMNQRIKDWGFNNPRLFKGIIIKDDEDTIIRDESHILNIIVGESTDQIPTSYKRMLELDLEKLLIGCKVGVSLEDEFNEESTHKIQEAVPLDNQTALMEYFGSGWQFTELELDEQELKAQQRAYEHLDFIKSNLNSQKREKRAREEEVKNDIPAAEIAEIEDIERKVDSLSAPAREELLARMQKYKEPKLTGTPPASKPITGIS